MLTDGDKMHIGLLLAAIKRGDHLRPAQGVSPSDKLTDARLAWLYGPLHRSERQAATRADINAWDRLGSVRRTAA